MCRSRRSRPGNLAISLAYLVLILALSAAISACAPRTDLAVGAQQSAAQDSAKTPAPSLADQAALEATAMIEQAKATAVMMKAQAQATALVEQSSQPSKSMDSGEGEAAAEAPENSGTPRPGDPVEKSESSEYKVELAGVGFAADGRLIIVQFHATRKAVNDFWPGRLSVTDESDGTVYNSVSVQPIIGPLIGRTQNFKQVGYVMFDHIPPRLKVGSTVTVQLGQFKQEHVTVSN